MPIQPLIIAMLLAIPAAAQERSVSARAEASGEAEIRRLDSRRIAAVVARDRATLETLMAPDAVIVENDGTVRTTQGFIAHLTADATTFDAFEIDENHVRIFGGVAVVTGRYHTILRVNGKPQPVKYLRHTRVWASQPDGRWLLVSHQATAIAPLRPTQAAR